MEMEWLCRGMGLRSQLRHDTMMVPTAMEDKYASGETHPLDGNQSDKNFREITEEVTLDGVWISIMMELLWQLEVFDILDKRETIKEC